MGRDLTFYPKKATKDELKQFIESLGFTKCDHLWDWPKGTLNYQWFDFEDFKSIDGVSADIYPVNKEDNIFNNNEWAIHVRNLYSASIYDVQMLNNVLREARKLFGGTITGDYGTNRYAPLWEDKSTPISRGIQWVYNKIFYAIEAISKTLPDETIQFQATDGVKMKMLNDYIKQYDPSRVLYNGLVPFLISMFEYFFSETFQILIKYDDTTKENIKQHSQKIDFQTLIEVSKNERTIENIIAGNYIFQNLNQLNKAYKEWLNIDVRKILFRKKKLGKSINYLENRIAEIIQYRHGIIHRFELDLNLSKEDFIVLVETVKLAIDEVINFLENKYAMQIERDCYE
ncbi:hypothetical protein AGMMS50268_07430 [Spirochaetia bacterium]|nr:hypothetical protein AGMMS50268_07430 [Spirochaetia bacterium]